MLPLCLDATVSPFGKSVWESELRPWVHLSLLKCHDTCIWLFSWPHGARVKIGTLHFLPIPLVLSSYFYSKCAGSRINYSFPPLLRRPNIWVKELIGWELTSLHCGIPVLRLLANLCHTSPITLISGIATTPFPFHGGINVEWENIT